MFVGFIHVFYVKSPMKEKLPTFNVLLTFKAADALLCGTIFLEGDSGEIRAFDL